MWLKLVCLMKHRAEAADECRGGHVKLNGQRVKPSAAVREGDVIEFLRGTQFRRVVVQGLPEKPLSKETARTMYLDHTPKQDVQAAIGVFRERGRGRPSKRERRDIDRLRGKD